MKLWALKHWQVKAGQIKSSAMKGGALIVALILSSCASLQYAGTASYSVRPFDIAGQPVCCEVSIFNGKEIASLDAVIKKSGADYEVVLSQRGIRAFEGQAISAQALEASINAAVKAALIAANPVSSVAPMLP
jgi:hypothetical protein